MLPWMSNIVNIIILSLNSRKISTKTQISTYCLQVWVPERPRKLGKIQHCKPISGSTKLRNVDTWHYVHQSVNFIAIDGNYTTYRTRNNSSNGPCFSANQKQFPADHWLLIVVISCPGIWNESGMFLLHSDNCKLVTIWCITYNAYSETQMSVPV